jgi:hypothetical protein
VQLGAIRAYQGDERALVLQEHHLGDFGGAALDRLQIPGRDLLAAAQDKGFLVPPGNEQETVAIDKAQIPDPVPAISRERRGPASRLLVPPTARMRRVVGVLITGYGVGKL